MYLPWLNLLCLRMSACGGDFLKFFEIILWEMHFTISERICVWISVVKKTCLAAGLHYWLKASANGETGVYLFLQLILVCAIVESRCKMVNLERNRCSFNLKNWHQNLMCALKPHTLFYVKENWAQCFWKQLQPSTNTIVYLDSITRVKMQTHAFYLLFFNLK